MSLCASAKAGGKAILLGEHAVVYGHPAIAVGLPVGIELSSRELPDPHRPNHLRISDWQVDVELHPQSDHPVSQAALAVLKHCGMDLCGWSIEGQSNLPARSGLGSSAALTVALAKLALGPSANCERIVAASLAGERVFHGQPSGLDSQVSARGGVISFSREDGVHSIECPQSLWLVIVQSGRARNTAQQIEGVQRKLRDDPAATRALLSQIGELSHESEQLIKTSNFVQLGKLMNDSHEHLRALGVSCEELDAICEFGQRSGAYGAKLTGAGGGGCALMLASPDSTDHLVAGCRELGFSAFALEVAA